MIGLADWDGAKPVILVPSAEYAAAIAESHPKASVIALPQECGHLNFREAWGYWLPFLGADVTLWPVASLELPYFAALVPVLAEAGVRTLRLATRALDDYARLHSLTTLWRDRAPHPGPPAGSVLALQHLRAERRAAAFSLATKRP